MYPTCLRCDRSLGRNAELPHLAVGRRVAFDTATGRLWVVCTRCGQWNLTPLEERWEALAECERLANAAEAHVSGGALGLARTRSGLELLRVGGMAAEDIANWRYGRRVRTRQRRAAAVLVAFAVLTLALSAGAGAVAGTPLVAVWLAPLLAYWFYQVWRHPPRLGARVPDGEGGAFWLWPWQLDDVRLVPAPDGGGPWLYVPHARGDAWLRGTRAATVLAGLLPKVNATDCTATDVADALRRVAHAEAGTTPTLSNAGRRSSAVRAPASNAPVPASGRSVSEAAREWASLRGLALPGTPPTSPMPVALPDRVGQPWERTVPRLEWDGGTPVHEFEPEDRLALEMAATEEVERAGLRARATAVEPAWRAEEEIGAIADDLLVPAPVAARLAALQGRRDGAGPGPGTEEPVAVRRDQAPPTRAGAVDGRPRRSTA